MATIEPLVVRVMREFKAALLLREQAQEADMADRYLEVEERLQAHIDALAWDFAERREQGLTISEAALYRMERYKRLRALTEEEVLRYTGDYAEPLIRRGQAEMGQLGIDNAASAINASYGAFGGPIFERLPYEAIENMVGLAGSFTKVIKVFFPQRVCQGEIFQGELEHQAECLLGKLRDNGLV